MRLYPINFRELSPHQRYRKYQWIEVDVCKHTGRDARKESCRPDCESIRVLGEPIPTKRGDWSERAKYALAKPSRSMEHLWDQQRTDRTSLGVFRPKKVHDLIITPDTPDWKPSFLAALAQQRLWDDRTVTKTPPRKVPFKFQYRFECDDRRCRRKHCMMIADWEIGALYWKLVDQGVAPECAAKQVRSKFLDDLCGANKDTWFFVGTILRRPRTWIVIGVFHPKTDVTATSAPPGPTLFD